jgi:hypothetical protein
MWHRNYRRSPFKFIPDSVVAAPPIETEHSDLRKKTAKERSRTRASVGENEECHKARKKALGRGGPSDYLESGITSR